MYLLIYSYLILIVFEHIFVSKEELTHLIREDLGIRASNENSTLPETHVVGPGVMVSKVD